MWNMKYELRIVKCVLWIIKYDVRDFELWNKILWILEYDVMNYEIMIYELEMYNVKFEIWIMNYEFQIMDYKMWNMKHKIWKWIMYYQL